MKTSRPGAWSITLRLHPSGASLSEARPGSGALRDSAADEPIDPVDHLILRVWIAEAREAAPGYGIWPALLAVIERLLEGPLTAADAEVILESLIGGIEQLADPPRAEVAYRRAAEMLEGLGVPESAVEARLSLATLLLAEDRAQDAEPVASEIRRARRSPKVHLLLARCRQSLEHAATSEAFEATPYAEIARRKLRALTWIFAPEEVDP